MRLTIGGVGAAAWSLWKRDRDLLLPVAALFLFLPVYADLLLLPAPAPPAGAAGSEVLRLQIAFARDHLGALAARVLAVQIGLAAITVLYCDPARPTLAQALARALRLLPRFLLAALLVAAPTLLGLTLFIVPGLIVAARTVLTGPLLVADAPLGAAPAVARSVARTGGQTAILAALIASIWGADLIAGGSLLDLEQWLRGHGGNPVALAMADGAVAASSAAAGLAAVLISIATLRLLQPSSGT